MPERDDDLLLNDMIEAADSIFEYVGAVSFDEFRNDKKTVDAVLRNFEVLGEASKLISEEIKKDYPLVEWRLISDFRNILIHHYFGIDYTAVWTAIKESLPYNYEMLKNIKL
jgi:uncharacterized protein with HEPN domain